MELRPPEECFHLAASATRLLNSTSYNRENFTNQNLYNHYCSVDWIFVNFLYDFYQTNFIKIMLYL